MWVLVKKFAPLGVVSNCLLDSPSHEWPPHVIMIDKRPKDKDINQRRTKYEIKLVQLGALYWICHYCVIMHCHQLAETSLP